MRQRMRERWPLLGIFRQVGMRPINFRLLALGSVLFVVAAAARAAENPRYGGTLRVEVQAGSVSLDPREWRAGSLESATNEKLAALVFERLVALDNYGRFQPVLAAEWSRDGSSKTLAICDSARRKVFRWHTLNSGRNCGRAPAAASGDAANFHGWQRSGDSVNSASAGLVGAALFRPLLYLSSAGERQPRGHRTFCFKGTRSGQHAFAERRPTPLFPRERGGMVWAAVCRWR